MALVTASPVGAQAKPRWTSGRLSVLRELADRRWVVAVLLTLECSILFSYGLNSGDLYRTEGLRAIIASEFLRSGNWIVPTLYGEPLFTKPPGMYAAIALLSWPVGEVTDWTARLPSALAATGTVLLIYWYFRRQLGPLAGLIAAAIVPASFMWLEKATAAEIDMMQVVWVTASILCFLRGLEIAEDEGTLSKHEPAKIEAWRVAASNRGFAIVEAGFAIPRPLSSLWFWWIGALLCVAGGVLTKWTAPAFFYGTVIPLLCWRGRLRLLWGRHHLVSVALGSAVCLAWIGAAVTLTGWHAFYDTVSREALMRLLPSHHYRPYPWVESLVHPFQLLATNLPWSAFALLTLRPGFMQLWDGRGRRLLQALHCWTWPNLFFWSIIPEHAPRHSFPLFPGIAGLAALVWLAWLTGRLRWPFAGLPERARFGMKWRWAARPGTTLICIVAIWLLVKILYVEAVIPRRNLHRQPRQTGENLATLIPESATLYLFNLKDEGVMFYYGRKVIRLARPDDLPLDSKPLYCILDDTEFQDWQSRPAVELVKRLHDQQGDSIALVRLSRGERNSLSSAYP